MTNIGTSVTGADGVAYPLPAAASLAGSCKLSFAGVHAVDAYAQADYFFRGVLRAGTGVEYGYNGLAFVRLGYSYGGKSPVPSCLTLGLGINYYNFTIDASYLVGNSSITNTLGISLGYRF